MLEFLRNSILFEAHDDGGMGQSGQGEGKVEDDGTDAKDTKKKDQDKPLTIEDVEKMIQSATDRVRTEYSKKLKDKEKELEELRLASMTEEERKAEEQRKLQETLDKKEAELKLKELTLTTIDLLKENELPLEAKDFLIGNDVDSTKANIKAFKKMFSYALEQAVTERFKQTGKDHIESTGKVGRYTQEDIAKMSPEEINANWEKIQRDLSGQ